MPNYNFKNIDTNEIITEYMTNSEREIFLSKNKNWIQIFTNPPLIGDPVQLGVIRTDNGFNDALKKVKSNHYKSNIQTR